MEAQFIAPPALRSMSINDNDAEVAIARRTGLEECRARLEAAAAAQGEYALLPSGTYLPPSSAMTHDNVHGAPDRAWVQQVAREAISSRPGAQPKSAGPVASLDTEQFIDILPSAYQRKRKKCPRKPIAY